MLLASGTLFAWAYLPRLAFAEGRDPRFLTIMLRGALDGLATVAPVGDPGWVALRGDNALMPRARRRRCKLDDFFALNPAMPNLHRMFMANQAIIVHACATPYRERSHFDGQDRAGKRPAKPMPSDSGWLNRALAGFAPAGRVDPRGSEKAFAVGPVTPLVVRGPAPVLSWSPQRILPASADTMQRLLDLYRHSDLKLANARGKRETCCHRARRRQEAEARPWSPSRASACLFRRSGRYGGEIPRAAGRTACRRARARWLGHPFN